jgi:hypothetical protein
MAMPYTTAPNEVFIDDLALAALRIALPGRIYTPAHEEYAAAVSGFSLADTITPDVVVMAESAADVVAAVNFARAQGLPVGVHATGHNFGTSFRGGLRVNTSRMQGFSIDPNAQTARVEAGVRWGAVVQAAHQHGLAPLNGSSPLVGVVGYSLFGGFGWLLRKFGAAVDSVTAVELVTADGQLLRASADEHADLFWALRGASGNFGIVTALEFKLHPVGHIYGGAMFFPVEQARAVFDAYRTLTETAPDELTTSIVMVRMPPLPDLPPFLRGRAIITVRGAFVGGPEEGARLMQPLRNVEGLLADTFQMMPYSQSASISNDPTTPTPVWRRTAMLRDISPELVDTLIAVNGADSATPVMVLEIRHLGGAMTRVPDNATSFSQRHAPFLMQTLSVMMSPEHAVVAKNNTQIVNEAIQPFTTGGVLPSWLGDGDHGAERTRAGFSPGHYARLAELKQRYDPENMFCQNHNVPPKK